MFILYNLVVSVLFLCLIPFTVLTLLVKPNLSRELMERLGFFPKDFKDHLYNLRKVHKKIIWINAASVGEIMMVQPLVKELSVQDPNIGYIIMTNSSSGQLMAKKLFGVEKVLLLPIDFPWVARRIAYKVKPKLTILVEFEMWPNLIHYLSKVGSKIVLVNGAMDNKILNYYAKFPGLLKTTLNKMAFLGMKTEEEKQKVKNLGVSPDKISVTGDLKYDGSLKIRQKDERIALKNSLKIPQNAKVLVAGSTHPGEEEIIFKAYVELKEKFKDLILIIAPRQIERVAEIRQLGEGYNIKSIERTKIATKEFTGQEVIILDSIGELADIYSVSTIAFVGGSFAKIGGHNLLEPIFYGKPVLFGPNIHKVRKTADWLRKNKIGFLVRNEEELKGNILLLLQNDIYREKLGQRVGQVLEKREGAFKNIINIIKDILITNVNKVGRE